jgi:hypothetical protein
MRKLGWRAALMCAAIALTSILPRGPVRADEPPDPSFWSRPRPSPATLTSRTGRETFQQLVGKTRAVARPEDAAEAPWFIRGTLGGAEHTP